MVVNIYHAISGNLLAKMGAVDSPEKAVLEYAKAFLNEEFKTYSEFVNRNPLFAMGLIAVPLH